MFLHAIIKSFPPFFIYLFMFCLNNSSLINDVSLVLQVTSLKGTGNGNIVCTKHAWNILENTTQARLVSMELWLQVCHNFIIYHKAVSDNSYDSFDVIIYTYLLLPSSVYWYQHIFLNYSYLPTCTSSGC